MFYGFLIYISLVVAIVWFIDLQFLFSAAGNLIKFSEKMELKLYSEGDIQKEGRIPHTSLQKTLTLKWITA